MYQYDQFDADFVKARSAEFRNQVERRVSGALSEEEFRPMRLQNGVYLQLHAYMLRVAVPYGVLSSKQLRKLGYIAKTYDKDYGHFTTRQNIQYNWPTLSDIPDILDHLAEVGMHAIQTSGNCVRNVTSDAFAGVAADEWIDPRPVSELIRQWSMLHPEFAYLPRKFKFAVTGAKEDRAAMKYHDIGIWAKVNEAGDPIFDIWVGGGQGRTPRVAVLFEEAVSLEKLLPTIDSMLRVYNLHGRRDNKYKARIKILVSEMGLEAYREEVFADMAEQDQSQFEHAIAEYNRIASQFTLDLPEAEACPLFAKARKENAAFSKWVDANVTAHKKAGYSVVSISVKPKGGIPGDATSAQMEAVADIADDLGTGEIRVTHRQNLVLPSVKEENLFAIYQKLVGLELAEDNIDKPSDIIACPGLDYCALATARSIPVAQSLSTSLREREEKDNLGKISLNISGCINACGHHHAANIGILGLNRAQNEYYQITLGGRNDEKAAVGDILGPGFSQEEVPDAVDRILDFYLEQRINEDESFSTVYERLGKNAFKEAVYVDA